MDLEDAVKKHYGRSIFMQRAEWVVQDRSFVYQMQTLRKLMKSLRKPDTLINYSERSYSWQQLKNREKAWRNPSFFSTIKIVTESYLQNELMTEYLRKKR